MVPKTDTAAEWHHRSGEHNQAVFEATAAKTYLAAGSMAYLKKKWWWYPCDGPGSSQHRIACHTVGPATASPTAAAVQHQTHATLVHTHTTHPCHRHPGARTPTHTHSHLHPYTPTKPTYTPSIPETLNGARQTQPHPRPSCRQAAHMTTQGYAAPHIQKPSVPSRPHAAAGTPL
jgi:hypothetical protein